MGIKGLMKLISDEVPSCVREISMSQLSGRTVAIDASMALYQFLIAIRSNDGSGPSAMLTNSEGETTSHIQGMFNRTIRLMEHGIKPVYVFDGKPPVMKGGELAKRKEKRELAKENLKVATESGDTEDMDKFNKRLVRATPQHNEDVKQLLTLMGVPFINAPCEAEATCAALGVAGKVYGVATEDMDALTFATPVLLRRLTMAASRKLPIVSINYAEMLLGLELSHTEFVDLCILCGCDYCDTIRGIGPKKAFAAIKTHRSIEAFLDFLQSKETKGVIIPSDWLPNEADPSIVPIYAQARLMFTEPEVLTVDDSVKFTWSGPKVDALTEFLVTKQGFGLDRVTNAIEKLKKAKTSHSQKRLTSFFKVIPKTTEQLAASATKRKAATAKASATAKAAAKKKKVGGKPGGK